MDEASDTQSITRVLIAATTPAFRAGLRSLLASPDMRIVGERASLRDLGSAGQLVDVVVLADDELLLDAARHLGQEGDFGLLVLADDDRPAAMLRGLPLLGWGVVPRDSSAAELQAAARAVAQGLVVLPASLARRLVGQRPPAESLAQQPSEPLTAREREVLELVSQGLSNKLIARRLQISEHTVKFHISSIFTKLGAASRTEAVSRGSRQGLITL